MPFPREAIRWTQLAGAVGGAVAIALMEILAERTTLPLSARREKIFDAGGRMVLPAHETVVRAFDKRQTTLLVRANGHVYDSRWTVHETNLEEIVLAYLGQSTSPRMEAVLA